MTPLLRLAGVTAYYGAIQALKGVDLEVNQGEIVTLLGSNGAGKSTLMMTICGNPRARDGTIESDRALVTTFSRKAAAELRTRIIEGTLTQSGLDPSLQALLALDKTGMLECWILLNNADIGIRFDYPAYRSEHREKLADYIIRYIIRPTPQPN